MNPSIHQVIETKSAANVITRCGDTVRTMLNLSQFLPSDRERMEQLVACLYETAASLFESGDKQLEQN